MIAKGLIRFYQRFISPFLPGACRFYPSCSEYALWCFEKKRFVPAFLATLWHILRCQPFSTGGIEYPLVAFTPPSKLFLSSRIVIRWWLVPQSPYTSLLIKRWNE